MAVVPNYDASIEFLQKWRAKGPWILTAIEPDRKGIATETLKDEAEVRTFLEEHGDTRNIYFSVNPTRWPINKKASREDIASLDWLHVDVDPRNGKELKDERERALRLLTNPPKGIPKPTCVVFSGGGYQGFWRLEDAMEIEGKPDAYALAARYNKQIERLYEADHCHNVDRIMRLPGTINRPDEKKRKKGRKPTLADVIFFDEESYPLSTFTPAPEVDSPSGGFTGRGGVSISGNIKRLSSIDDLPDDLPDWVKVLIVQGFDPENPGKFESRSECLFAVLCAMARCPTEIDDDTMFSVITDPDFHISESVLEKKGNAEKYAIRQISRAKEVAIDPALVEFNDRYAVIQGIGGKCRIVEEVFDPGLERFKLQKIGFDDFRNAWMNRKIQIGEDKNGNPVMVPLGKWWLEHPKRRQYRAMAFEPGIERDDVYNLWRGFAVEAKPGEKHESFLTHIKQNLCDNDPEVYDYLIGWLARLVQFPAKLGEAAVILQGDQGTGKSFFAKTIGTLVGRHFLHISNSSHLTGNFNAHLRDCVFLFADEAFFAGDKRHESVLKTLITERHLVIEAKGVDAEPARNCVHLVMASNEEWVVPAGFGDRRFFVLNVSDAQRGNPGYFRSIQADLDDGGYESLLAFLLAYDLSDFEVRNVPKTKGHDQQKKYTMPVEKEWWFQKLVEGFLAPAGSGPSWPREIPKEDLYSEFVDYATARRMPRITSKTAFAKVLSDFWPGKVEIKQYRKPVEVRLPGGRLEQRSSAYWYVDIPPLEDFRKKFEEVSNMTIDWEKESKDGREETSDPGF
ncbi:MAG: hypothetical protein CMJ75_18845 [Planctomycetaceae bacterium]|nr:hypothetical protein [Planctomycetaceae bacterium]